MLRIKNYFFRNLCRLEDAWNRSIVKLFHDYIEFKGVACPDELTDMKEIFYPDRSSIISHYNPIFKVCQNYFSKGSAPNLGGLTQEQASILLFLGGYLKCGFRDIYRLVYSLGPIWEVTSVYRPSGSHKICAVDVAPRIPDPRRYSHFRGIDPRLYARRSIVKYVLSLAEKFYLLPSKIQIAVEDNHLHIHSLAMLRINGVGGAVPSIPGLFKINDRNHYERTFSDKRQDAKLAADLGRIGSLQRMLQHNLCNDEWYPRF